MSRKLPDFDTSPLIDGWGRIHTDLRLSVTDRCNIRCAYCMPAEVAFQPKSELLTYEEITRVVRVVAAMGVRTLRITGGEPLVRNDVPRLIRWLKDIAGIEEVALTTNGILLDELAAPLHAAGLDRVNISLDTLDESRFLQLTRRQGLARVLRGIEAALAIDFCKIRLNAIAIQGFTEPDVLPLAEFARKKKLELRFIEFMPLDADEQWKSDRVLTGAAIRDMLSARFGTLRPVAGRDASQPARDYAYADGGGVVGFIEPVSAPFCGDCNRLRLTSEGQIRNCLFASEATDVRRLLRSGGTDADLANAVRASVARKKAGHGIDSADFLRPRVAMYQIGG